eukprot:c18181_g1_i7.p2 GENE.c18181_g1_i7~~c18181_g1_i7.p2  ORF type:complete len:121 (+),score=23.95 c18181_g1_i7:351-713(+)
MGWAEWIDEGVLRPVIPAVPIPLDRLEEDLEVEVRLFQRSTVERNYAYCWVVGKIEQILLQNGLLPGRTRVTAQSLANDQELRHNTDRIWVQAKLNSPAQAGYLDRVIVPYCDIRFVSES